MARIASSAGDVTRLPKLTPCPRCGADVLAVRDHNGTAATVIPSRVGAMSGLALSGDGKTAYFFQEIPEGRPTYQWHDLDTTMFDHVTRRAHLVPNIRCGEFVRSDEKLNISDYPLRWPEMIDSIDVSETPPPTQRVEGYVD